MQFKLDYEGLQSLCSLTVWNRHGQNQQRVVVKKLQRLDLITLCDLAIAKIFDDRFCKNFR